ncbi:MAG TPA: FAD-binding protein [Gemmatimonadales bacterium]|nr:FAD-binding protein [Gemmatimonadales bacterium]
MLNPEKEGPQEWCGVHVTHQTTVAEIINVDNVGPNGALLSGWEMFRFAGESLDLLIRQARAAGTRILPIGSGWALSRINITDGWLVNTKLLNGCYDIGLQYLHDDYPAEKRRNVVLAQAGLQIAELNAYLELLPRDDAERRAIQAAGIGNGQTIAGSVSGNTHGSQISYGAMPDFIAGLHIATGGGQTLWIERKSKPVVNDAFVAKLGAKLIRDDDIFHAAVVSFGTFGIIAAVAVEAAPIYQLEFPAIVDISYADLKQKLTGFAARPPADLYHYEFIFDPYSKKQTAMEGSAPKVAFKPGVPTPKPRWIIRDKGGYAPGINVLSLLSRLRALVPPGLITGLEYKQYRKIALLNGVRGTPGQIYTSSIYYLEGYIESAYAVAVGDAPATIDISSAIARSMRLPYINQVRLCKASTGTLAFTHHEPITAVFEFGMIHDGRYPEFEARLDEAFRKAGIRYSMHWSKNSGLNPAKLEYMYGARKIASWKAARRTVFGNDQALMKLFETDTMVEAGLA